MKSVFHISSFCGLLLFFCYESAFAAGDANYGLLFGDDSALSAKITAPLSVIMQERDESEYHEGTFRYADSIGNTYEVDVEIRARGNFRRRRNVCQFAPLRLIFSGEQPPNSIFEGQEKLKLVTHCDRYVPVPYDFDLAGIVNATYAAPNPKYGIDEVTDRLYRGFCSNTPLLAKTLQQFRNVEPEITRLIDEQVGLKAAEKVRMQRYVDKYYADVDTQKAIRNNLVRSCN